MLKLNLPCYEKHVIALVLYLVNLYLCICVAAWLMLYFIILHVIARLLYSCIKRQKL